MTETPRRRFRLQGNAADYYVCDKLEVLCESGAGTGKTFSLMVKDDATLWENPGCRILWVRRTRKSMSLAPLPDFEKYVLWPGHPALAAGAAHYKDRDVYRYPTGSELWLAGFDSQEKIDDVLSSQWDRIRVFQAEQIRLTDYEKLLTRLRAFGTPYHQITLDVNPADPGGWIAKKFGLKRGTGEWEPGEGKAVFSYRHEDNPAWYDAEKDEMRAEGKIYVGQILEGLTGVRREQLLLHRWVRAEGMIWGDYDAEEHIIHGKVEATPEHRALLTVQGWAKPVELRWFMGSMDWGFEDPAAFQCYGFDSENRAYLIREEYRKGLSHDEWAEKIGAIHRDFPMRTIVVDTQPALIKTMNRWLSDYYGGREVGGIVQPADKTRDQGEMAGLDIVRSRMKKRPDGSRGIYFLADALVEPDPDLRRGSQPLCLTDEIPSYTYRVKEDGKPWKEEPDPLCVDHGCDCLRYMAKWAWGVDLSHQPVVELKPVAKNAVDYAYEVSHLEALAYLEGASEPAKGRWRRP